MTERGATRIPVTGERLAAYRARAHDLAGPATLSHVAVLGTGVADYPIGASAHLSQRTAPSEPVRYRSAGPVTDLPDVDGARRTLLRRFLRVCGPARPADLAGWLGFTPAAARRWWTLLADELEAVDVQGEKAWMHGDDLVDLTCGDAVRGVALIPPRDPFTEVAARDLVVSDPARRRAVWRAAGQPGLVLVDGVPAGTWRHRRSGGKVTVTVDAFDTTAIRAAKVAAQVQDEAGRLAAFLGADPAATTLVIKD